MIHAPMRRARYRIVLAGEAVGTPRPLATLRLVEISTGLAVAATTPRAAGAGVAILRLIDRIAPPTRLDGEPLVRVVVDERAWPASADVCAEAEDLGVELVRLGPDCPSPGTPRVERRAGGVAPDAAREIIRSEVACHSDGVPLRHLYDRVSASCGIARRAGCSVRTPSVAKVRRVAKFYRDWDCADRSPMEAERRFRRFPKANAVDGPQTPKGHHR